MNRPKYLKFDKNTYSQATKGFSMVEKERDIFRVN